MPYPIPRGRGADDIPRQAGEESTVEVARLGDGVPVPERARPALRAGYIHRTSSAEARR